MNPLKIINLVNKKDYILEFFKKSLAESTEETLKQFSGDDVETAKKTIAIFCDKMILKTKEEFKDIV